jgi:hypothetical protein
LLQLKAQGFDNAAALDIQGWQAVCQYTISMPVQHIVQQLL